MSYRRRNSSGVLNWTVLTLLCVTLTLVLLKLGGVIGWSWWIVLSPVTVPVELFAILVVALIVIDLFSKRDDDDLFGE